MKERFEVVFPNESLVDYLVGDDVRPALPYENVLAVFIVKEVKNTFRPDVSDELQLAIAINTIKEAANDFIRVVKNMMEEVTN